MGQRHGGMMLRAVLLAGASVSATVVLNLITGGPALTGSALMLPIALSALVGAALARQRRSSPRLAISVAVSQVLLHELHLLCAGAAPWMVGGPGAEHGASAAWAVHGLTATTVLLLVSGAQRILDVLEAWARLGLRMRRAPALAPARERGAVRLPSRTRSHVRAESTVRTPAVLRGPPRLALVAR